MWTHMAGRGGIADGSKVAEVVAGSTVPLDISFSQLVTQPTGFQRQAEVRWILTIIGCPKKTSPTFLSAMYTLSESYLRSKPNVLECWSHMLGHHAGMEIETAGET